MWTTPLDAPNVSSDDLGTVDEDGAACGPDRHVLALHGRQHLHVHEVLGMHGAGSHVVRQQVHELRLVLRLEQVGEDALGESGERLVGRGEDGERALTRESADEVGSLERGDEGRELWRGGSDVHDVFRSRLHHQHPARIKKRMGRIQSIVQVTLASRRVRRSAAPAVTGAKGAAGALRDSYVLVVVKAHGGVMPNRTCGVAHVARCLSNSRRRPRLGGDREERGEEELHERVVSVMSR